jgi:hypothetical protein
MLYWPSDPVDIDFVALSASIKSWFAQQRRSIADALVVPVYPPDPRLNSTPAGATVNFSSSYEVEPPPLVVLELRLRTCAFGAAEEATEIESALKAGAESGAESIEAVWEARDIQEHVDHALSACELKVPTMQFICGLSDAACKSVELKAELCLATSMVTRSSVVPLNFSSLFAVIKQLDLLARGHTNAVTAAVRSLIAVGAIGFGSWVAKTGGAILGFAAGAPFGMGPAGATALGAGAGTAAGKFIAKWLSNYYIKEVRQALERLNGLKAEFVKKKQRDSAQTFQAVADALAQVEIRRAAKWRTTWARFNPHFWRLKQAHILNQRRLLVSVREELRQSRQELLDSTARRRFLGKLTRWQRLLLWLSPTMRRRVSEHFRHLLEAVSTVLEEVARAKDLDTRIGNLLAALGKHALYTASICTEVTCFLTERQELCAEAEQLLRQAKSELQRQDVAFLEEFNTAKAALQRAYDNAFDSEVKALSDQERQVGDLARAAGISLVLSKSKPPAKHATRVAA